MLDVLEHTLLVCNAIRQKEEYTERQRLSPNPRRHGVKGSYLHIRPLLGYERMDYAAWVKAAREGRAQARTLAVINRESILYQPCILNSDANLLPGVSEQDWPMQ